MLMRFQDACSYKKSRGDIARLILSEEMGPLKGGKEESKHETRLWMNKCTTMEQENYCIQYKQNKLSKEGTQ